MTKRQCDISDIIIIIIAGLMCIVTDNGIIVILVIIVCVCVCCIIIMVTMAGNQ